MERDGHVSSLLSLTQAKKLQTKNPNPAEYTVPVWFRCAKSAHRAEKNGGIHPPSARRGIPLNQLDMFSLVSRIHLAADRHQSPSELKLQMPHWMQWSRNDAC
eukprot:4283407-Amphidinium_carterae.1